MKKALILVDLQNDFMPGGALAVKDADHILPVINFLLDLPFDIVVATKDWHPTDHGSFVNNHPGKKSGEHIYLAGVDQILWPAHCIQGTKGSEFAAGWDTTKVTKIVYKGTERDIDSYSTFFDNDYMKSTGLEKYLKEQGVKDIYIAGLATDYCVKYSVLDAIELGFNVHVIVEGCRGVNLEPDDSNEALRFMSNAGAELVSVKDLKQKAGF